MYAPKLRFMTNEERWYEGFCWKIDQQADAALAEIKEMADKARAELCPPSPKPEPYITATDILRALSNAYPNLHQQLGAQAMSQEDIYRRQIEQASGLRNVPGGLIPASLLGGGLVPWMYP